MAEDFPASMYGATVKRAALGANRSDANVLPKTIGVIHDIEGGAGGALAKFATAGDPEKGGGSTTHVADPDNKTIWQLMGADSAVAYGCGNYEINRRAIQIELPGHAGIPYDPQVIDYAARWVAWCNYTHGIPLTHITRDAYNKGALSGFMGHSDCPDPNNPALGGGEDHHTDPGPTFNWTQVLDMARRYVAGSPPLPDKRPPATGDGPGDSGPGDESRVWPSGFRVGGGFYRAWATGNGYFRPGQPANSPGSVAVFGYPVSRVFVDEGHDPHLVVQYFERARFEKHPDGSITLGRVGAELSDTLRAYLPPDTFKPEG